METLSFPLSSDPNPLLVPPNFILPEDKRTHRSEVSASASIPIINMKDLGSDDDASSVIIQKISQACEEYGFFQIINHGVPQELCDRMLNVMSDFFELPPEEKKHFFTTDLTKQVRLYNHSLKIQGQEKVEMWSKCFFYPWHPIDNLPENPPLYREIFAEYAKEIHVLMIRLLSLISLGLGLEKNVLQKRLGEKPNLKAQANYYPPCPEPELTMGLNGHTDPNAITVLRQSEGVTGLQILKDGKWIAADPIPNSFLINLGDQIQVMSNGRYKSVYHRVVTNKSQLRLSMAMFYGPDSDTVIGPIEELIDEEHPPIYKNYRYPEFIEEVVKQLGRKQVVMEAFELQK